MDGVQLEANVDLEDGELLIDLRCSTDDGLVDAHQYRTGVDSLVGRLRFGGTEGKFIVFAAFDHEVDDVQDVVIYRE